MEKHTKRNFLIILIVVLLAEIFVFNFKSFRMLDNTQEYFEDDIVYLDVEGYTYIKIENVNTEVKTVYLELNNADNVSYEFVYTDEAVSSLTTTTTKQYLENVENSKYISCYLSRKIREYWI